MTSSQVRKTSKEEETNKEVERPHMEETETFPFYKSPTTSPHKDSGISGIRSIPNIPNTDEVEDIPLADRHVSLNKEKTKVIKKRIKKEKDKESKEVSKKKKGKNKQHQ